MTVVKMTVLQSHQLFKYVHSLCTSISHSSVNLVPSSLISRVILIVWEEGTWALQKEQDSSVLSPKGGGCGIPVGNPQFGAARVL